MYIPLLDVDILDKATERALYLGMIDIIFAYAYDHRITESEHSVSRHYYHNHVHYLLLWL